MSYYLVTVTPTNHTRFTPLLYRFVVEAFSENNAVSGVKRALDVGVLLPYSDGPGFTVQTTILWPGDWKLISNGEFEVKQLPDTYSPTHRIFPDPSRMDEWVRFQLSWYGRLWQDLTRAWWKLYYGLF